MNKKKIMIYLSVLTFAVAGFYLTFFAGNINKYNSKTTAYRISPNESIDRDGNTVYQPIYYFKVDGREYECMTNGGSSFKPNEKKNVVYYDSANPEKCATQYGKTTSKIGGIICLIAAAVTGYFFIIKSPSESDLEYNSNDDVDMEGQYQYEEGGEKALAIIGRIQLIYKRIILGIIIIVLLVFILIDTVIVKQTIKAKDYTQATAIFVDRRNNEGSSFDDCTYGFTDKQGVYQEIIISIPEDNEPKAEIKIKYDEKNPQEFYEEGSTMDKSGFRWFIGKIVVMILLIMLFFNKKLLSKINIVTGRG